MSLAPGTSFGPYQIIGPLGAGGMGEVYRARDTKLDRDVALKTLPETFATDAERLARFEREAKTLASLNHPHIAQVYAIEGAAIVMELVDGEDLSERLKRGPIPLDEAIPVARQIAEALEAAHDAGIIHRDLKPGNVKVRADGTVKVLDFGLAKAVDTAPGGRHLSAAENSPTITTPAMTMQGVILGTAAYMAPEQAKGKFVDRRADIWAFGCVLYEMLTGARTFLGEDVSDTLVSILRDDPRWAALPADTPANVRQLLRRCLQKDPRNRLPHLGVARLELSEAVDTSSHPVVAKQGQPWLMIAGLGAVAGAVVLAAAMALRPAATIAPAPVVQFAIEAAPGSRFTGANGAPRFALSPDGRELVYQTQDASGSRLLVRALASSVPQPLPGTEGPLGGGHSQQPFWSPDGRFIAFFDEASGQLKKLDRSNGLIQVVADVPGNQLAGSWGATGTIVFASAATGGVRGVSSNGGAVTQLTTVDREQRQTVHLWPSFLPGGKHFVFHAQQVNNVESAIYLGSVEGEPPVRLFESQTSAVVAAPDQLVFGRDNALMSQGFDMQRLALVGEPRVIADQVPVTTAGRLAASASTNGTLAHGSGTALAISAPFETYWFDRAGAPIAQAPPSVQVNGGIRLSRDGKSLSYSRGTTTSGSVGLWIQDTARGIETQLAEHAATGLGTSGSSAVFSPDGTRVLYRQSVDGAMALFTRPSAGTMAPVELLRAETTQAILPMDWAADGGIVYSVWMGSEDRRLFVLPGKSGGPPVPYLKDLSGQASGVVSPDGRWLAYTNGVGVAAQVFVQSFPDPSIAKATVSGPGAAHPRWNPRGGELFFANFLAQRLMAVPIKTSPRLEVGVPEPLLTLNSGGLTGASGFVAPFDVMPDGNRFVALRPRSVATDRSEAIVVTINWMNALR